MERRLIFGIVQLIVPCQRVREVREAVGHGAVHVVYENALWRYRTVLWERIAVGDKLRRSFVLNGRAELFPLEIAGIRHVRPWFTEIVVIPDRGDALRLLAREGWEEISP